MFIHASQNQISGLCLQGLPTVGELFLTGNQLASFDCTGLTSLQYLDLSNNPNLEEITIPGVNSPEGCENLRHLDLRGTALGSLPSMNSNWYSVTSNLPSRSSSYKGNIYVSNAALKALLQAELASKHWDAR
jgi:hypothetical protein